MNHCDLFHGHLDMRLDLRVFSRQNRQITPLRRLFALASQPDTRKTHVKELSRHKAATILLGAENRISTTLGVEPKFCNRQTFCVETKNTAGSVYARKSKHRIPEEKPEIMRKIIEGYNVQTTADLQEALKDLLGGTIQTMLVEKLDCQIAKREASDPSYNDARNGYKPKTLRRSAGEIPIQVPRDRNSDFEPVVVPKHQRDISEVKGRSSRCTCGG